MAASQGVRSPVCRLWDIIGVVLCQGNDVCGLSQEVGGACTARQLWAYGPAASCQMGREGIE